MFLTRPRRLVVSTLVVALAAMVGVAVQRELMPRAAPSPVAGVTSGPAQNALSVQEEAYAATLWPIHSEVVEVSAVDMNLAGIAFMIEHHDAHRLEAQVLPLGDRFRTAADKAQAM
jgi:hypothetical protein